IAAVPARETLVGTVAPPPVPAPTLCAGPATRVRATRSILARLAGLPPMDQCRMHVVSPLAGAISVPAGSFGAWAPCLTPGLEAKRGRASVKRENCAARRRV